jgi:SNF2 family DNA or RNA helicase
VTYLRLLAADTIEDAIVKALERKSAMARTLLGDSDNPPAVSELTKEEMCSLLQLNRLPDR